MKFFSLSNSSDQALEKFFLINKNEIDYSSHILSRKVLMCDYDVFLITTEDLIPERLKDKRIPSTIVQLSKAWQVINVRSQKPSKIDDAWKTIEKVGKPALIKQLLNNNNQNHEIENFRTTFWQFNNSFQGNRFFIFLTGMEEYGLPLYDLHYLCNLWQINRGCLPIHSAGFIRREWLYLFTGPSGVGKSTVIKLSKLIGGVMVDDDIVSLRSLENGFFTGDAWGYNVKSYFAPLRAIFLLNQATEDRLSVLNQKQITRLLTQQHLDVLGFYLSDGLFQKSFRTAAKIARQIPGYELHFRKSPDFWKLIDAEFPD